jgi:hypothetical protein
MMNDIHPPVASARTLLLSTAVAALLAGVALVTVVLPAEWGVDPTGLGRALGLTRLAEGGADDASEAESTELASAPGESGGIREDTVQIEVPARSGLEYKFQVAKGVTLDYEWKAANGMIFAELHGEPKGDTSGYYEDFTVTHGVSAKGSLETPFAGCHGWYWKNDGDAPVIVTLDTRGDYIVVGKNKCAAPGNAALENERGVSSAARAPREQA